jgi:hypothetical protein
MDKIRTPVLPLTLVFCLVLPLTVRAQERGAAGSSGSTTQGARTESRAQANPQVERQRQEAEQQARKTLDTDAVATIEETQKAVRALSENKPDEAIAAIERATGKVNVLLARSPSTGLVPADLEVVVIDAAPMDVKQIRAVARAAERAMDDRDYPAARVLLQGLVSEIRVRTYNVPLVSYPVALKEAARLVEQKKTGEATAVLQTALNTLVIVDRVIPLPVATADAAIAEAQSLRDKDKERAKTLLAVARIELDRARELGYAGKDPEYAALAQAISDVEKQLNGNQDSGSAFGRLKERVASFFKRQSQSEKRAEEARV